MNKKILLVDDDRITRMMLERSLEGRGFDTAQAANGRDAVFLAKDWKPDLIILDIMMPEMDGTEAAGKLRQNPATKDIPIIFLTSILSKNEERYQTNTKNHTFLAKPCDEVKLLEKIRRLVL
jgi:twitching motility two-component system response regulator PilH